MDPIKTLLKLSSEEREQRLRSYDNDTLLYMMIPYFNDLQQKRKLHSRRVLESSKRVVHKRKLEEIECQFRCDWEVVKTFWSQSSAATTVRNYQTSHMQWTELASRSFPGVSTGKLLVELMNNPEVIEEYVTNCQSWSNGTKADRLKYEHFGGQEKRAKFCLTL